MSEQKIPKRILTALMNSLAAGVVPRSGAPYIAIGRGDEINAMLSDLENISDGGASVRFVIGKYGSGKSFLMQLIRGYSLDRDFITADADLSPERRICGAKGSGIATYRELMKNFSSKTAPDGGALPTLIAKWLSGLQTEIAARGILPSDQRFETELSAKVYQTIGELEGQIGGFDFASVINTYRAAYVSGDDETKSSCMRWLRGEYSTKTEARASLKVGSIIDDDNWYEYLKLLALFVRKIGYRGLVVFIDECVNLYKIANRLSRENNYEKILSMFNDTLQGRAPGIGIVFGGTPQFLEDTRRGLFSYEALRSRLADGKFSAAGYKNMVGPVIRLRRLSDDELYALIARITKLHAQHYAWEPRITSDDMAEFLKICLSRAGADTLITPREIIRDYMSVLNILYQNANAEFAALIGQGVVSLSHSGEDPDIGGFDDEKNKVENMSNSFENKKNDIEMPEFEL